MRKMCGMRPTAGDGTSETRKEVDQQKPPGGTQAALASLESVHTAKKKPPDH